MRETLIAEETEMQTVIRGKSEGLGDKTEAGL